MDLIENVTGEGSISPFPSLSETPKSVSKNRYLSPKFYEARELVHAHDGELIPIEQLIKDDLWDTDLDDCDHHSVPRSGFEFSGEPIPDTCQALLPFAFISIAVSLSDQWESNVGMDVRAEAAQCAFNEHVLNSVHLPEVTNDVRSIWMSGCELLSVINRAVEIADFGW